jgi:hypothetical protein
MSFSQPEILVGLRKAKRIATERSTMPMYALYLNDIDGTEKNFDSALKKTEQTKLLLSADIQETASVGKKAKDAFYKYRALVTEQLTGAGQINWPEKIQSPEQLEVNLEKLISLIEDNKDKLPFAAIALQELHPLSDELDKEITEDQSAYRAYHTSVDQKDAILSAGAKLFLRVRRFIRRDLGAESPEYSQLKDKAVRQAAQEEEQNTPTPVANLAN